jgi:hypothetical protein
MAVAMTSSAPAKSGGGSSAGSNTPDQLERAELLLYEPVPNELTVGRGAKKGSIQFQFNPKEVSVSKSIQIRRNESVSVSTTGPVEFTGVQPGVLKLDMLFDASDTHDGSVVAAVEKLLECCTPVKGKPAGQHPFPMVVAFHWGSITSFPAVVTSVQVTYTVFTSKGLPIRAKAAVTLEEIPDEPQKTNPTSGGLAARRAHTLVDGDTLASVAYREYNRADMWRPLAAYNGIDDPMALTAGQTLLLPTAQELLRGGHRAP